MTSQQVTMSERNNVEWDQDFKQLLLELANFNNYQTMFDKTFLKVSLLPTKF